MSAKSIAPSAERKRAGDFLPSCIPMRVALGLIVGEGHRRIVKEAQRVLFARCEAQEEIVSGSARRTAAPFSASLHGLDQWRLGLVECQPFGENGVVTALDQCDQRRARGTPRSRAISPRDRRAAVPAAFCAPSLLSRFRREPSVRASDGRCTRRAARPASCNRASSDRGQRCRRHSSRGCRAWRRRDRRSAARWRRYAAIAFCRRSESRFHPCA